MDRKPEPPILQSFDVKSLRETLCKQINSIEEGTTNIEKAREISRTSQAILESVRLEILYRKTINGKEASIDFMDY
jgi:hypothetical protein